MFALQCPAIVVELRRKGLAVMRNIFRPSGFIPMYTVNINFSRSDLSISVSVFL